MAVRARRPVVAGLLAVAVVAWWFTAIRMAGMDNGPGTDLGGLGWFAVTWTVMMVAMMLPSLAPTAAVCSAMTDRHDSTRPLLFAAGYLLVWSAAGVGAYALFDLGKQLLASPLAWSNGGRVAAAGVLALSALYQLTPLKRACLIKCRSSVQTLGPRWRDGQGGALISGIRVGGWCLGCCWALMAALFALGVMNLIWMALIAGLVMLEKLSPWRRAATIATAAVLLALAVGLAAAPEDIPGLVVPASSRMKQAMNTMALAPAGFSNPHRSQGRTT